MNYIVTFSRYFSFRLPHLNINTWAPSDELDRNILILKVAIDATGPRVLNLFSLVLYCLTVISPCTGVLSCLGSGSGYRACYSPRFLCRPTALFFFARAVGRQRALHTENSGFSLQLWVSTFPRFVAIWFYQKPLYKSLHQPSYPQKVVLHCITARFSLRPYDFVISHPFWNICHVTSITAMYHGRWFAYKQTNK